MLLRSVLSFFSPLIIAFSMYSKIPMPQVDWNAKNMRYAICFFPVVGLIIAFLEYLLIKLHFSFFQSGILRVCLMLFIPIAVTGGIHIDGFIDTNDALSSYAEKEKRLEILKDPHIGAFAIIHFAMYVLLFCGFCSIIKLGEWRWICCFVISRVLSGLSVVTFKCAKKEGTLYTFAKNADRMAAIIILIVELVIYCGVYIFLAPISGSVSIVMAFFLFWIYYCLAKKKFGGITGDIAGWFLCNAELWMIISFALTESIVLLWS